MTLGDYIDRECRKTALETTKSNFYFLLEELGEIPQELKDYINDLNVRECLRELHRRAARAGSIEDFEVQMDEVLKNTMALV